MSRKNLPDLRVVDTLRKSLVDRGMSLTWGRDKPTLWGQIRWNLTSLWLTKIRIGWRRTVLIQTSLEIPMPDKKTGPRSGPVCFYLSSPDLTNQPFDPVRFISLADGTYRSTNEDKQTKRSFHGISFLVLDFVRLRGRSAERRVRSIAISRQCRCIIVFVKRKIKLVIAKRA